MKRNVTMLITSLMDRRSSTLCNINRLWMYYCLIQSQGTFENITVNQGHLCLLVGLPGWMMYEPAAPSLYHPEGTPSPWFIDF